MHYTKVALTRLKGLKMASSTLTIRVDDDLKREAAAVSYTHLDVYKRQVSDYIAVEGLAFLDTFSALYRTRTTDTFDSLELVADNHSIGLLVDMTRGANPNERPFN